MCNSCFILVHSRCEWVEIPVMEDVQEWLDSVKELFESTKKTADRLDAEIYINDFYDRFNNYSNKLAEIEERVNMLDYNTIQYNILKKELWN